MMNHTPAQNRLCRQRGSAYALVLGCAALLSVAGIAAVSLARRQTLSASQSKDWTQAGMLAESAVDDAVCLLNANTSWRTQYVSGVEAGTQTFGRGTFWFKLVDETDGKLSMGTDPVRLYGIGRVG